MPEQEDKVLTTVEVANRFGLTDRTIRRHIKKNLLPALALSSRHWLIKESDLQTYVENVKKVGGRISKRFEKLSY